MPDETDEQWVKREARAMLERWYAEMGFEGNRAPDVDADFLANFVGPLLFQAIARERGQQQAEVKRLNGLLDAMSGIPTTEEAVAREEERQERENTEIEQLKKRLDNHNCQHGELCDVLDPEYQDGKA